MKSFCDKSFVSRQPFYSVLTGLVLLSLLLHPISLFAKPSVAVLTEELAIDAPTLIAPASNATTTGANYPPLGVPKLEWEPVKKAEKYGVEVSTSAGFAALAINATSYGSSYTPQIALADGEYFWRVRANDGTNWGAYSEIRSFIKDWSDDGNIVVQLISPLEAAQRIAFTNDDFTWAPMAGAAMYKFEISSDPSFSNIVYTADTIKAQHTPTKRLPNNLYYWRVTPIDNRDHFGTPSAARSFHFNWNIAPQLLSPDDDTDLAFVPRFSWTAVEAARKYELQIGTQQDFGVANIYQTTNTEYTPEKALSNDQDYYWRVKAIDYENVSSPWSQVRRFRAKWNFQTQLLAPVHNTIKQSNPFFAWTPIAGTERYQLRVDESTSFDRPLMDEEFYNVTTAAIIKLEETTVYLDADYFWQVRGIDAQDNYTPWSDIHTFRFGSTDVSPNPVYPLPYYTPDTGNLPVHDDHTIAWPLFVWDSSVLFSWEETSAEAPAYYELTVASDLAFQSIHFQIETTGPAAAPTLARPFTNLQNGNLYHWRVRAYRANGQQLGVDHVWTTRIDQTIPELPKADAITPIYPRDGFESIVSPPLLGWLPMNGVSNYRVQISSDPNFNTIVDEAEPQFVNYAPWQGRRTLMPFGTYWWRVRGESAQGVALGGWSEVRRFNLAVDLITSNKYDFVPPAYPASILGTTANPPQKYLPAMTYIAGSTATVTAQYELSDLHIMLNRIALRANEYPDAYDNYNWIFAFGTGGVINSTVKYGIYIDSDHIANSGATSDPLGKAITVDNLYRPEYVIYITPNAIGDPITPNNALLYSWTGAIWDAGKTLTNVGGDAWYDATETEAIQLLVPYGSIGANAETFPGSLAVTVFSTPAGDTNGIVDSIPPQGATLNKPALVSNIVTPLYPFDTPLTNPVVHYDMPPLRWRMSYFDSVDGYEVQIARDAKFTDLVETWELNEKNTVAFYPFITTSFQSRDPYADNESYYWRVRIRHERYNQTTQYDYGPWSPAMRFKLDSRQVGNPTLSTGELAETTPSFWWDRVEGAAGYTIQVDNDANFSSPVIARAIDGTSYTPVTPLPDGTYYWRVAMRRSDNVIGHWTPTMSFVKQSLAPETLTPINGQIVNAQPTFKWTAVLTPTAQPRVAAPLYRLQMDEDPNFGSPTVFTTESTAFTLPEGSSIADGTWYWRVAVIDSDNKVGAYSQPQQFYKEYLAPKLVQPGQNSVTSGVTSFEWDSVAGAAYYEIEIDDDPLFNSPLRQETDNTKYTPTKALPESEYYWRVRMYDEDRKPGPFVTGRIQIQAVSLSLGNYVWIDNNNNGTVDSGEPPVANGVVVELLDGAGAALGQTTQTQNGFYHFTGLNIGEYRVRLAASNFGPGSLLQTYGHSTGVNQESDPNSNGDQNDNGIDTTEPAVDGIISAKVALGQDEPLGETPTTSGTPGADGAGTPDQDSNLTVDFGIVPATETYSLGNFVGADANNDGQIDIDTNQKPVPAPNGVVLELLNGDGSLTGRTTTTINGYYLFSGLAPGNYRVRIAASNFAVRGALENYQHSTGLSQEVEPNSNGDQNDNGLDTSTAASAGITSGIITLGDGEPTGEMPTASSNAGDDGRGTDDAKSNLTVDFALIPGQPTAFDKAVYLPVVRR